MNKSVLNKRIPTLLGLIIIIFGLSVTTLLTNKATFLQSNATENKQPQDVRITNISDNSFTVSYTTVSMESGFVKYGSTGSLDQTAFDDKDTTQKLQTHIVHSITLNNLNPDTKYYFSINSGGETYLDNNNNFEITTAANTFNATSNSPVSGRVMLANSNPPKEAIVYITVDNSQVLSTLVNTDGTYKIDLQHLLNFNLSNTLSLTRDSVIKMLVAGDSLSSNVTLNYYQSADVPVITLSNNYDFREGNQQTASPSAALEGFPMQNITSSKSNSISILSPSKDQVISTQQPVLKGQATPNQNLQITIHSQQVVKANVITDSSGNWSYQPTTPLDPGTHTITVTGKDSKGILRTITESFTVYAAENSSTATAAIETPTNTPTTVTAQNKKQTLITTNNTSIITAIIVGLIITFVGGFIFLLSRKGI